MKYYRQAYLDLLEEFVSEFDQPQIYRLWINRFFDQNEIAFVYEWTSVSKETLISELQDANLSLTNEKNKYLTIFESSPVPIIVFGSAHRCINMNYAAQQLLYQAPRFPGLVYDTAKPQCPEFNEVLPWLNQEYEDFCRENEVELQIEKEFNSPAWGYRYLDIKLHRMLDVSGKFDGTVIRFNDLTDLKKIESKLRQLGFHDQLTGLYNRAYLDEEVKRLANGGFNPVGFISIDIDGMKLVNDHFGHIAGDTLLKDVSQILKESFRASDIVVRMGGDEFGVLLPSCDAETAEQACQRVRNYVKKKNESGAELPISLSIGWAIGNFNDKSDIDQMIKNADAQMYSEKQINHQAYQVLFQERFGSEKAW
jgi:diguanylate cyclase (GGDEF)-like protein